MENEEIELMDFFRIIWKRKWMILIGTLAFMVVAGVVSFILTPIYEIDAIIQPGKFFLENASGNISEFVVESPEQIANKIKHGSFHDMICGDLSIQEEDMPDIEAEPIGASLLARAWIRNHDVERSKKILNCLIRHIKDDIDGKIRVEINNLDTEITSLENTIESKKIEIESRKVEKDRVNKEIVNLANKLKNIEKRKGEIVAEMKEVRDRIDALDKQQSKILENQNRTESESLGLLLYMSTVQQNLRYFNTLQELLSTKEMDADDIRNEVERKKETQKLLDNQIALINNQIAETENRIANLKQRKERIDATRVVKEPTVTLEPVFPRKKLNILIGFFLGLIGFTLIAFFLDYADKSQASA